MMADSIVERVARAQEDAAREWLAHYVAANPERAYFATVASVPASVRALAAIKAMRIPDRKMLDAASRAMSPGRRPTEKRVSVRAKHGIRYRAMIDAALEGTE